MSSNLTCSVSFDIGDEETVEIDEFNAEQGVYICLNFNIIYFQFTSSKFLKHHLGSLRPQWRDGLSH